MELLVENLSRLNETEESDREGVFHILGMERSVVISLFYFYLHCLGIFENTLGFNPVIGMSLVSKTNILSWLLERISGKTQDANRGYAAEVLSILLQDNRQNRLALGEKGGVEVLLKVISVSALLVKSRKKMA